MHPTADATATVAPSTLTAIARLLSESICRPYMRRGLHQLGSLMHKRKRIDFELARACRHGGRGHGTIRRRTIRNKSKGARSLIFAVRLHQFVKGRQTGLRIDRIGIVALAKVI